MNLDHEGKESMDFVLGSTLVEPSDEGFLSNDEDPPSNYNEDEEYKHEWTFEINSTAESKPSPNFNKDPKTCATVLQPSCQIALPVSMQASCSQFSMDGKWIAIGMKAGYLQIRSVDNGRLAFTLDMLKGGMKERWPCTALCIRPCQLGDSSYNVLLSCDLNGHIHYWHVTSGMHLGLSKEFDNNIHAIDFHSSGVKFATGGSDCKVRIYDAVTRSVLQILQEGDGVTTGGHSNQIFAVKWHSVDANIALSGGWDNTIQIWDIRAHHSVRSIFGPQLCGDALDVSESGGLILTGSWRASHQLQEWDFGSGKLLTDIPWQQNKQQPCRLYAAKYGKGITSKQLIAAGGSGSNEGCLFSSESGQNVARLPEMEKAIHSMAFSANGSLMAITTTNVVNIVDLHQHLNSFHELL